MNDVLTLHLHNGDSGNAPVAWSALTPLIEQMEALITKTAEIIVQSYVKSPRPSVIGEAKETARLLIAGPPRRGSIILPFVVELPVAFDIIVFQGSKVADTSTALGNYLGSLADLAALATFIREIVFGSRGLIAGRTDQVDGAPGTDRYGMAIEQAAGYVSSVTPDIERLLRTAEATGCEQIEIKINDQAGVKLIMANRRRRSGLLARHARAGWSGTDGPPRGLVFNPDSLEPMQRRTDKILDVLYQGQPATAIVLHMSSPASQAIVAIWRAQMELPRMGDVVEIRGKVIDRRDVEPQDDVPQEFEATTDVFLVESARPTWR